MNQNGPSEGDDLQDEVADVDAGEGEEDELQSVNGNGARKRIRQHANPAAEDASGGQQKNGKAPTRLRILQLRLQFSKKRLPPCMVRMTKG